MPLVLASASPRRRALLEAAGVSIERVCAPNIEELRQPGEAPRVYARRLAAQKAAAVIAPECWVLAADTVVHMDYKTFEKPTDDDDAARLLTELADRWHQVSTAWRLAWGGPDRRRARHGLVTASVRFRALSSAEILAYVRTGEGRDKAGAYGVQGLGAALVESVRGSYATVVGLPMTPVLAALRAVSLGPENT